MKVYLIGKTQADLFPPGKDSRRTMPGKASDSAFQHRHEVFKPGNTDKPWEGESLIEFAGRLCYESWDLPNLKTSTRDRYIANILAQGHESVLEHVSVTFYVEGVSRTLSHELIRHRHLSFSELSQRFVDMEEAKVIAPPALKEAFPDVVWDEELSEEEREDYAFLVDSLRAKGKTRKQAREAARGILPGNLETKFVVTGNLRAWRDVLKKRDSEHADAEMQLFAQEVKRQLANEYPNVFKDLNASGEDGETA